MKRILLFICISFVFFYAGAQTGQGIGTSNPNPKAVLDLTSTTQGLLVPRMTQAQRTAISPTAAEVGLLVFDITNNAYYIWNGAWQQLQMGTTANPWIKSGLNVFQSVLGDNVGIGTTTPTALLDVTNTTTADAKFHLLNTNASPGNVGLELRSTSATALQYIDFARLSTLNTGAGTPDFNFRIISSGTLLSLSSSSVSALNILANGNVGIGTLAPVSVFSVLGAATDSLVSIRNTSNGTALAISQTGSLIGPSALTVRSLGTRSIGNHAAEIYNLATKVGGSNSTKKGLYVESTGSWAPTTSNQPNYGLHVVVSGADNNYAGIFEGGNVGIGTTSPNAPLQLANVVASRKIVLFEAANNDHQFYGFGTPSNQLLYQIEANTSAKAHVFSAAVNATSSVELMRIRGDGKVGIGTNAPLFSLDIRSAGGTTLNLDGGAGSDVWTYYGQAGSFTGAMGMRTGGKMTFFNGGNDRMVILSNGSVGMGTISPDPDAILELSSSAQGFLPPRLTTAQRNAITTPPNGLVIYNTTINCLEFYRQFYWASTCGSYAYIFTDSYVLNTSATAGQINAFNNYRAGLAPGNYNSITMSGSLDKTGVSCSDPSIVNQLATALKNSSSATLVCGGNTWVVGSCGGGPDISVNNSGNCACGSGFSLRPQVGGNWGGIGVTCNAASQTLNLIFE